MRSLFPLLLLVLAFSPLHASESPPIYHAIEPAFVVNVIDGPRPRFMQLKIQVMTRDPKVVTLLENNLPAVRHAMILLLSGHSGETVRNVASLEQLRLQALEVMRETLVEVAGVQDGLEALYFTDRVVQ